MWRHYKAWLAENFQIQSDSDSFSNEQLQQILREDETYNYDAESNEEPLPSNWNQ